MFTIVVFTAITTFLFILLLYKITTKEEQLVSARVQKYAQPTIPKPLSNSWAAATAKWLKIVRLFSPFVSSLPKTRYLDKKLIQAGIPLRGSEFFVLSILLAFFAGIFFLLISGGNVLVGLAIGIIIYLASNIYLSVKIARRMEEFNHQLGDTLQLMANALRSGNSFLQAVDMVSKEMSAPISVEFARLLKEMSLGAPAEEALNNLVSRVPIPDLDLTVTAILIQRQIGGNLAEIMDNIATTIQDRYMMKKEIRTLTAQGRISGWIIGLLPLVTGGIVTIMNPTYTKVLFTDPVGWMMLGYGTFSLIFGILVIRKIVDIDM